ncbi:endoplasmic reticulum metallopeptidase 1-like isoform X1 [Mytilus galloprovincialis]|uniref:endoplasmic reticulum metallopeptidase 1-like isoform X1 n=1 Tax=Mytilus galloprovincialis TaxID=29158 RepID=UPI003F7C3F39
MTASTDNDSKAHSRKGNTNINNIYVDTSGRSSSVESTKSRNKKQISALLIWPTVVILYTVTFVFLHEVKYNKYPEPKYSAIYAEKGQFFEDEARKHLLKLCSFGPKPAGSNANEVQTVQYIVNQIDIIKESNQKHSPVNSLTIDIQKVSGSFLLKNFVQTNYYSVYENLQNVVVLLEPPNTSKSSLLINCHFDSVVDSPGAGDNIASCAVMLELLRVLYISKEPLKHNIIFLFNGAEENILQASHGFITQHPWVPSIKAFINLDSAGAGGWETVFQTGPEHPWLVKAYAESALYPYGSILGQELFQSGVIPSDTDYRIFRDFGNLPGLDIAYIANGYIYHTQHDKPEYIPSGSIQRAGDNLLSVIKHLCSSEKLEDPGADKHGTMVFFDFLGLFMIHYPSRIGAVFNCGILVIVTVTLLLKYKIKTKRILSYQDVSTDKTLLQALVLSLACWILLSGVAAIVGVTVDLLGQPMFWFSRPYNIILVYGVMSITIILVFHYLLKYTIYKTTPDWYVESLYHDATMIIFCLITLFLTYMDFASAFLPMLWILGPYFARYVVVPFFKIDNTQGPSFLFVFITLLGQLFQLLFTLHSIEAVYTLFIPIAGRAGGNSYPDVFIAMLTAFTVLICMQYLVGFVYLCSNMKPLLAVLGVILVSSLVFTQFTNLGFPYSGKVESPTSQRGLFFHINRNFHNLDRSINRSDSGIWYLEFDHNGASLMQDNPVIRDSHYVKCEGNYCGMPYMYPLIHVIDARLSLYSSKPPPVIRIPVTVTMTKKMIVKDRPRIIRFHIDVTGPDHMSIYITPVPGAELIRWSITNDSDLYPTRLPSGVSGSTYFIYYSYGIKPDHPWNFFVDIKAPIGYPEDKPLVDIAFNGHYSHGKDKTSPELDDFKKSLPDWVVSMSWICSYDSYLF